MRHLLFVLLLHGIAVFGSGFNADGTPFHRLDLIHDT